MNLLHFRFRIMTWCYLVYDPIWNSYCRTCFCRFLLLQMHSPMGQNRRKQACGSFVIGEMSPVQGENSYLTIHSENIFPQVTLLSACTPCLEKHWFYLRQWKSVSSNVFQVPLHAGTIGWTIDSPLETFIWIYWNVETSLLNNECCGLWTETTDLGCISFLLLWVSVSLRH
jgi:hypothetical protein